MNKLILIFLLSISAFSITKIELLKDEYVIVDNEKTYPIQYNGVPEFISKIEFNKKVTLLVYKSGDYGTSERITIYRAVAINKDLKLLSDFPFKYVKGEEITLPELKDKKENKTIEVIDSLSDEIIIFKY